LSCAKVATRLTIAGGPGNQAQEGPRDAIQEGLCNRSIRAPLISAITCPIKCLEVRSNQATDAIKHAAVAGCIWPTQHCNHATPTFRWGCRLLSGSLTSVKSLRFDVLPMRRRDNVVTGWLSARRLRLISSEFDCKRSRSSRKNYGLSAGARGFSIPPFSAIHPGRP
jgi:hypothetical protein